MVLWEITLGTAYFLGLKRTYRLALRIQRRIISPKHPKIRQFVQRRTRSAFDVAHNVHRKIQQRDIEVGRNLGNWILRWLDRMKPSAQIRGPTVEKPTHSTSRNLDVPKHSTNSSHLKTSGNNQPIRNRESDRHLFSSLTNTWHKPFPTVAMMMRPLKPAGTMTQYRHLCVSGTDMLRFDNTRLGFDGVVRRDIMQWMLQK